MSASPAASATKATVSVEYAKSSRSACKGCSAAIDKGALRLGAHGRDPRGYESTKWYHVACFPASEHPLGPVEKVPGFDSIKDDEREELRELEKNNKRDRTELDPLEEPSPKKAKADLSSPEAGVAEMGTVSVEYAKSGRSTCKGCNASITKGALRLGVAVHDHRGWDSTKWYHVACLPTSSHPLGPVEKFKGFDSIKDDDRVELSQELEKNNKRDQAAVGPLEVPSPNKAKTEVEVAEKNDKREQAAVGPLEAPSPKKAKACLSIPEVEVAEKDGDHEELRELVKNNNKRDQTALNPLEEPSSKKAKAHLSSPEAGVAEKGTVSVEYAKSGRSTCKGCNLSINKGALRLGILVHDPRGYDNNKWYHAVCFPTSSHQLGPVEKLKGFDSIKDDDRMELQELEKNNKRDQAAVGPLEEPNRQKARLSLSEVDVAEKSSPANKGVGTVIPFSASHVKKTYKDATLPAQWKAFETVIFREQDDGLRASAKIAAFDFDGCLAKTSVKITGADKWSLQHKSIPDKLQSLYNDGYKLVIFTNESNIEHWKNKRQKAVDSKVGRLDNFIDCVKVPIQVFIACGVGKGKGKGAPDDQFRKPNSGMWWLMAEHFNSGIAIDMDQSFYVGDAAGRENDHSDADIEFAKDIGLKFHVPEEFFGP